MVSWPASLGEWPSQSYQGAIALRGAPALVAHDAGAAAHMRAWVSLAYTSQSSAMAPRLPRAFLVGPASRIFNPSSVESVASISRALDCASWVLAGSSADSQVERQALKVAARRGIPSLAVLDHWTRFAGRFSGLTKEELPRHVVVTDEFARRAAVAELPWANVVVWPNDQLTEFREQEQIASRQAPGAQRSILWINEPVRVGGRLVPDPLRESTIADVIWSALRKAMEEYHAGRIVVRAHPTQSILDSSEVPDDLRTVTDSRSSYVTQLASDVAQAVVCLGLSSYALYLARQSGKPAHSVASVLGLSCALPPSSEWMTPEWAWRISQP
jgi:hypothetical protein